MSLAPQGRQLPVPPLVHLERQGSLSVGGGGVALGVSDSLLFPSPSLSPDPIPFVSCSRCSIKGKALLREVRSFIDKGAVKLAPPSPGFYSHLFVVWKTSGSWRPVIDLSLLNKFVLQTPSKMETTQSVPLVVRRDDWMVSIDVKAAYLQVLVPPGSRRTFGSWPSGGLTSSRPFVSVFPQPLKSLSGSWLRFRHFFTV